VEEKRPGESMPVFEDESGTHILNSKDLCLIDHLPRLQAAGIASFKIEGRMKTAYYAAAMANAYKSAVRFYAKHPGKKLPDYIRDEVMKVSHRHYCTGFCFGDDGQNQHYPDSEYIRQWDVVAVVNECGEDGLARVTQKNRFFSGQRLELLEPGKKPLAFNAGRLKDAEGADIDSAPHPHMTVVMRLPRRAREMAIIRGKRPAIDNESQKA